TILSIPFSVVLSFLGARNLMKQVTMPLGNVLVGVVLLPVGWLLGNYLLSPIGRAGIEIGKDSPVLDPLGALAILGVVAFGYGFINRQLQQFNKDSQVALGQSLTKAVSSLLGNSLFLAVAI